jgi:hypothetical protein
VPNKIRIVCATRGTAEEFHAKAALGRSLGLRRIQGLEVRLFPCNTEGLARVYNRAIDESRSDPAILVFAHDDVFFTDFYWTREILESIKVFDITGVAGNKRRGPKQPSWFHVDERFTPDDPSNLSGIVGHGDGFPTKLDIFGAPMQRVKLLDGVILWCTSNLLHDQSLRFDERFDFHFYDQDFCRVAEKRQLELGTWPFSIVHESAGSFGNESWQRGYRAYLDKWRD